MSDHKVLFDELRFNNQLQPPVVDRSGITVIIWDNNILGINDIDILPQVIHVSIKVNNFSHLWFLSIIYASNNFNNRKSLWLNLSDFSYNIKDGPITLRLLEQTSMKSSRTLKN